MAKGTKAVKPTKLLQELSEKFRTLQRAHPELPQGDFNLLSRRHLRILQQAHELEEAQKCGPLLHQWVSGSLPTGAVEQDCRSPATPILARTAARGDLPCTSPYYPDEGVSKCQAPNCGQHKSNNHGHRGKPRGFAHASRDGSRSRGFCDGHGWRSRFSAAFCEGGAAHVIVRAALRPRSGSAVRHLRSTPSAELSDRRSRVAAWVT
jgi:hypothetical protein